MVEQSAVFAWYELLTTDGRNAKVPKAISMSKLHIRPGKFRSGSMPKRPVLSRKTIIREDHVRNGARDTTSQIGSACRSDSAGRCRRRQLHRSGDPGRRQS